MATKTLEDEIAELRALIVTLTAQLTLLMERVRILEVSRAARRA